MTTTLDPFADEVRRARQHQNETITVFVEMYITGNDDIRSKLRYGILDNGVSDYITDEDGKAIGEFRIVRGVCQVDWLRSVDDLFAIDEVTTHVLKEGM